MKTLDVQKRIVGALAEIWEPLPDKEAHLSIAQLRELDNVWREIQFQAKGDVCTHDKNTFGTSDEPGYFCFDCGRKVST